MNNWIQISSYSYMKRKERNIVKERERKYTLDTVWTDSKLCVGNKEAKEKVQTRGVIGFDKKHGSFAKAIDKLLMCDFTR